MSLKVNATSLEMSCRYNLYDNVTAWPEVAVLSFNYLKRT